MARVQSRNDRSRNCRIVCPCVPASLTQRRDYPRSNCAVQVEVLSCRRGCSQEVTMSKKNKNLLCMLAAALFVPAVATAQAPAVNEWLSFGYDQQRSGWNSAETTLTPANVGKLKLLWSSQLPTPP